jgi:hypothetical protein
MATKKNSTKSVNSGRATTRDVLSAVLGLNERIDDTNERVDRTLEGQVRLSEQMTGLHNSMHDLREATNDRLHEMKADIITLKRPWLILASGWSKALAVGGFAAALTGTIVKLELWRYLPF